MRARVAGIRFRFRPAVLVLGLLLGYPALADQAPGGAAPAAPTPSAVGYKPGERAARPGTVTITDVHSNKVRYDENEAATSKATVINTGPTEQPGTLVATLTANLDAPREVAREELTLAPGQQSEWEFAYNVGPETYGRVLEVRFLDPQEQVLDAWQEYYAVAKEFMRVQQHTTNVPSRTYRVDPWTTYQNFAHQWAHEPTDWGVYMTDTEQYIAAQSGYYLSMPARKQQYAAWTAAGVAASFYQTWAAGGQMGYEILRRHPEFALYETNGQFMGDAFYPGTPNPMELASPLEIGPQRPPTKPYLDRHYRPWQHVLMNLAPEASLRFFAQSIRDYAPQLGATGVFIDGNVGVSRGYDYTGHLNVPSDRDEDYIALNVRNQLLFAQIVRERDPNFGIWYNWSREGAEYLMGLSRGFTNYLGSGVPDGTPDDNLRAAASVSNTAFLSEHQTDLLGEGPAGTPSGMMDYLCSERDLLNQRYGANRIVGYMGFEPVDHDDPGPSRWGWATVNYFGAQLIATQTHLASGGPGRPGFRPSHRPTLQFMTRCSRFIWAPDVKIVLDAEGIVRVNAPEEIWWKRLVYRIVRPDGYDLVIHLVRIPPYPKWDLLWAQEPTPLEGVTVTADLGHGKLVSAQALRPYYFEEPQQVVQTTLDPPVHGGRARVSVPPFRYHIMLVLRVRTAVAE